MQTTLINPQSDSSVALSTVTLLGNAGMSFVNTVTMTATTTANAIASLTTQDINTLANVGVDVLNAGGQPVNMTLSQVSGLANGGISLATGDVGTLVDSASTIASMTSSDISHLAATGVDFINPLQNTTIPLNTANMLGDAGMSFVNTVTMTASATGNAISALTTQDVNNLVTAGVDLLNAGGDPINMTLAQVSDLANGGIGITNGGLGTLVDSLNTIGSMNSGDIANLVANGISLISPPEGGTVPLDLATVLGDAGVSFVDTVQMVASAPGETISGLTGQDIGNLVTAGIDQLNAGGDPINMTLSQVTALADGGISLDNTGLATLVDSGANIASMTLDQIGDLANLGIHNINAIDNNVVLTVAEAQQLVDANMTLDPDDVVTVLDTGTHIANVTAAEFAAFANLGVDFINAIDNSLTLNVGQILAVITNDIGVAVSDFLTVADIGAQIAALTVTEIGDLKTAGVDAVNATDDAVTLTLAQAKAFASNVIAFGANDIVKIVDTAAHIATLTVLEIAALEAAGIDAIDTTDDAVTLTLAQAKGFATGLIAFAQGDVVKIVDAGASIAALTVLEIVALKAAGVDAIDATDDAVALTLLQAKTFAANGIAFAQNDVVKILDAGASIAALTVSEINALHAAGINAIDATDDAVALTLAKAKAFAANAMTFAEGDVVKVVDAGATVAALTVSEINALKTAGIGAIDTTDDAVALTVAQAKAFAANTIAFAQNDAVRIVDAGAAVAALTVSEIAALKTEGVEVVDATDNALSLTIAQIKAFATNGIAIADGDVVSLLDTGAHIAALTTNEIATLKANGVAGLDAIDNNVSLTTAQAKAFLAADLAFVQADVVKVVDTGAHILAFTLTELAGLKSVGVDVLDASDDAVSFSVAQAKSFATTGLAFATSDVVTVTDTGAAIASLLASDIANLKLSGVDVLDASDDQVALTVAQAQAYVSAGMRFDQSDVVHVIDTGAHISAFTATEIASLKALGVDGIDATDAKTVISVAEARAYSAASIGFAKADIVKVVDTGAAITAMTAKDFSHFKATGIDRFDASDNVATLTAREYKALSTMTFANNDFVTVNGTSHANTLVARGEHVTLHGLGGNDKLTGGKHSDVLAGGLGHDILKGGSGRDEFLFDTKLSPQNVDTINGFNVARDHIGLDDAIFKDIGARLSAGEFHIGSAAHDRTDRIIYDKVNGDLLYDHDGKGHDAAVKFADIDKNLHLTSADFLLV
jgi:hypothetical protein